jgi:hypothetical protein
MSNRICFISIYAQFEWDSESGILVAASCNIRLETADLGGNPWYERQIGSVIYHSDQNI